MDAAIGTEATGLVTNTASASVIAFSLLISKISQISKHGLI
jgi:hypothetical protein